MGKRRPSHNYSEDTKRLCLEIIHKKKCKKAVPILTLSKQPNASSRKTLQYWKHKEQVGDSLNSNYGKMGPEPKLSYEKILVVSGWVFEQAKDHQIISGARVKDFIFNKVVSKSIVSKS